MITQMSRRAAGKRGNPMEREYLTFVPLDDEGCSFSFSQRGTGSEEHPTIEYSIDRGVWTALESEASTPTVAKGHEVRWRGNIVPVTRNDATFSNYEICGMGVFSSSGGFKAYGNPLSVRSLNFRGSPVGEWVYCALFVDSSIIDASGVYITDTRVSRMCCTAMFYGCASLVSPPQLPATNLRVACYQGMFRDCISLATPPNLPATTLSTYCYRYMFQGCTSLVNAPELPATTLTNYCYNQMFQNCSSLTYIKMLAIGTSATSCLTNWVRNVPKGEGAGVFVKNAAKTDLPTGNNGIPEGWTVVDDPSTVTE